MRRTGLFMIVLLVVVLFAAGCAQMENAKKAFLEKNPGAQFMPIDADGDGAADALFADTDGDGMLSPGEEVPGTRAAIIAAADVDTAGSLALEIGLAAFGITGSLAGVLLKVANKKLAQRAVAGQTVLTEIVRGVGDGLQELKDDGAVATMKLAMSKAQSADTEKAVKLAKVDLST